MSKAYTPTPEDIAKREARKAEKAAKRAQTEANGGVPPSRPDVPRILRREWVDVVGSGVDGGEKEGGKEEVGRVKVATWNMLAQTLVREYPLSPTFLTGTRFVIRSPAHHPLPSACLLTFDLFCICSGRDLFPGSGQSRSSAL
jgi:hypothetical protein